MTIGSLVRGLLIAAIITMLLLVFIDDVKKQRSCVALGGKWIIGGQGGTNYCLRSEQVINVK